MVCFCFERQLREKAEINHGNWSVYNIYAILRFLEFVAGLVVIGIYGQDIHMGGNNGMPEGELYAVIVGVLSSITALVLLFPHIRPSLAFWWDCIVFLLYVVLFGIFGKTYLGRTDPGLGNTMAKDTRLHHAVYLDAAAMILWFCNACYSTIKFWRGYKARKGMPGPSEMGGMGEMGQI